MYADTDFLLALIKKKDWLKESAEKILQMHYGQIWTSTLTLLEILMVCHREKIPVYEALQTAMAMIEVRKIELDQDFCLKAAALASKTEGTVFDMMHALACGNDTIISSDKIFDKLGMKRIKLEEKQ